MRMTLVVLVVLAMAAPAFGAVPEWLRKAEVYNGWYKAWDEKIVSEKMKGVPLVIGAPADKKIVDAAHKQGTRVISYITLYQMPMDQAYQAMKLSEHPDWIVTTAAGDNSKSVFWGSENVGWYEVCANNASYRKAALEYINKILDSGIDGLFIDNAHPPAQCYGEKLGKHKHIVSGLDHIKPWQDFIREVVRTVKTKNKNNVVILNPGEPSSFLKGLADGIMIESYICTHASKTRWHSWDRIMNWAQEWGDGPDQIVTLSYIGFTSNTPREDAFYCYSCARLSGFLWADWYSKFDDYKDLFAIRLGDPTAKMQHQGAVYYRKFEHGIVAVNPTSENATLMLPIVGTTHMTDQFAKTTLAMPDMVLRVTLPPASGRVYAFPTAGDKSTRATIPHGKGVEIYSWKPAGLDWRFSLIIGTNRAKWPGEWDDRMSTVVGVSELKKRLGLLAAGEWVGWLPMAVDESGKPTRSATKADMPPVKMVKDIEKYCKSLDIHLQGPVAR